MSKLLFMFAILVLAGNAEENDEQCQAYRKKAAELASVVQKYERIGHVLSLEINEKVTNHPSIQFKFPTKSTEHSYVRYTLDVPSVAQSHTDCFWLVIDDLSENSTVLSYRSSDGGSYHLWVGVTTSGDLVYNYNGSVFVVPAGFQTGVEYHVCSWNDVTQQFGVSCNGEILYRARHVSSKCPRGHDMIIGMNEGPDGKLYGQFRGSIGGVVEYERALTQLEMKRMAYACLNPTDFLFSWEIEKVEIHGDVDYEESSICPNKLIQSLF